MEHQSQSAKITTLERAALYLFDTTFCSQSATISVAILFEILAILRSMAEVFGAHSIVISLLENRGASYSSTKTTSLSLGLVLSAFVL
jgi:hypothetical protein